MNLVLTDGGRKSSGFNRERNDCVVRAIAVATNTPYHQVHKVACANGRKPRHRTKLGWADWACKHFGLRFNMRSPRLTLRKWLETHQDGRWVVHKRGHAFAVIGGVVFDDGLISERVLVDYTLEVYGWPKEK